MKPSDPLDKLIRLALEEDIGTGDVTTDHLISPEAMGKAEIVAKEHLVISGLDVARRVFEQIDTGVRFNARCKDGDSIRKGELVADLAGRMSTLLTGERTALNFLQRLSGIASHVRTYVALLDDTSVKLLDTRKTTPGWRNLEKYAVRCGGAANHRMGLYDAVLIKDNHIAACGGIAQAVEHIRTGVGDAMTIEVETADLEEVEAALAAEVDIIMLDNMDLNQIRQAVKRVAGRAALEVSGGITHKHLKDLADTGIDYISSGALTHSARAVDLSMRISARL